jgi:hypothetical protein
VIRRPKIVAWLLSLLLVLAEIGALAHELEHQVHSPDAPCAQCLFVSHLDKLTPSAPVCPAAVATITRTRPLPDVALRSTHVAHYSSRAPPYNSESS